MHYSSTSREHFSLTPYYSFLQGSFWMSYAVIMGFATIYLQDKNFSNTTIGLLLALGTILSIFLQPILGFWVDKSSRLTMLHVLLICTSIGGICGILLQIASHSFLFICIPFIIIATLLTCFPTFLNVIAMDYINSGKQLHFGLGRGMGSISYAFIVLIMGFLVKRLGTPIIVPTFLVFLLSFLLVIIGLQKKSPIIKWNSSPEASIETKSDSPEGILAFLKRYRRFCFLLIGMMLLFVAHTALNTYHINIMKHVGGDAATMGFSLALSATLELPAMLLFTFFLSRVKCGNLLKISAFFFTIKALIAALATQVGGIYFSQAFQFASFAIFIPASVYYVNHLIEEKFRGTGQALLGAATVGLGGTLGNFIGGKILDFFPVSVMLIFCVVVSTLGFCITLFTIEN
ncbi:hypothetical protein CS063_15650 [Sporanaerobium hydrogeniformans]|uniref:Uncharacterized protein n=1 Tax=Sporanaerobium hydrogeniformans TaxID=3072179 RepID=A0AC61D8L9_9FIRM|nr:MFS transporter [Sporanaerobium hydrogeniformans]PHV69432.1 hypothetical protein CS063_15650 [Sporanaerobium hydrogeniformans]